jgi:hypothetical protein
MRSKFIFAFSLFTISLSGIAQPSGPFDSYDCRPEAELEKLLERQRTQRELAKLDSIRKVEEWLAAQTTSTFELAEDTINGWKYWTLVENFAFGKNRGDIPMITSLEALHPYFRDKVIELISRARKKGIELAVVETYRTRAKQMEYKSMGNKYTRTGAGASKHQYGLAVDLVPIVNGEPQWHNRALWYKVGIIGERLGLRWGGRWRRPYDPGHFEWTGGLSTEELASGMFPVVPNADKNYPCIEHDLKLLKKYWNEWEINQATMANTR